MRRLVATAAAAALGAALAVTAVAPARAATLTLPAPSTAGITVIGPPQQVGSSGRLWRVTMRSQNIFTAQTPGGTASVITVSVGIYLPPNYNPATRYHSLYLLHGGAADYAQWTGTGIGTSSVEKALGNANFQGVVVMPEGGATGWYTNWTGATNGGFKPAWEDFHTQQLTAWVDANFRTAPDATHVRAVAGASMGGLGALRYAVRHPATFSRVGSFSGGTQLEGARAREIVGSTSAISGAATFAYGLGQNAYRIDVSPLDGYAGDHNRLVAIFGAPNGQGRWPLQSPVEQAKTGGYAAFDRKVALYAGQNEQDQTLWAANLRTALGATRSRYCVAPNGGHDMKDWEVELADFVAVAFQGTSYDAACPATWDR